MGNLFEKEGYVRISNDDFGRKGEIALMKVLPNEYITKEETDKMGNYYVRKVMYDYSNKYEKAVFDDIEQYIIQFDPNIYVVVLYVSLEDLARNIIARKLISPRHLNVFRQYANKFVASNKSTHLGKINRTKFYETLKQMKYEFASENELIKFADKIFADMDIHDNEDHYVKLRENHQYDLIVNTHGKSPEEIYNEIKNATKN